MNEPRPQRIDIYADGSWLFKGKYNPAEAGGWGALVVETYANGKTESWTPSGPAATGISNSSAIEIQAAVQALQAV